MMARFGLVAIAVCMAASPARAADYLVHDPHQYMRALGQVEAGDAIILANGEWRDFDLVVTGKGREGKPIVVKPQEPGKVVLTGQSSLRLGGEHILVSGLVFKDGYSPRGEVISFRVNHGDLARSSRVTQMVIDNFSKPDRYESDYWVGIYGQNNRFDHNHMVGKTNKGVTLAVRLDAEGSRDNGHHIDHNYFGPRPVLGSNGGETLRIGTSKYSMFTSGTVVESNVFDRCDGEVEIISSKSGGNVFRGNVFLRSRGTLTLRHGDNNLVERNVFLGYGKDYTGGIRVINRNQTVRENYMEGLRGTAFSSALAVMNGVPNSPVNRYVEVENARIENNSILDSARIGFGVGADEERSAAPSKTTFANNLMSGSGEGTFITADSDVSGITYTGNRLLSGAVDAGLPPISTAPVQLARADNGLLYPVDRALSGIGAPRDLQPVSLDAVGVAWYAKPDDAGPFGASGSSTRVVPGSGTLVDAIRAAPPGEVLMLAPGHYIVDRTIPVTKAVTVKGQGDGVGVIIQFARPSLFELREGGHLQLENLVIDGALAPDSVGNSVIRTTTFPIQSNILIEMDKVTVRSLTVNKSFNVLTLGKSTMADRVTIRSSHFADITGAVISAAAEKEDFGQYNVEYVDVHASSFVNIGGPVADIYRGGRDESTFGPFVTLTENGLINVGKASTNASSASIILHGVQTAVLTRNTFAQSAPLRVIHTVGTPKTTITDNSFANTPAPVLEELNFKGDFRAELSGNTLRESAGK